ncbi:zincin [Basidiobolus meristosporus CBS 931.73]|uniref:Zincin n=1 Tax=Basidiobolus meristosporus CBS 931.73 TaxID=1314790 RepID=A0A1Y1W911_9FUNG|nr:zincin [Basidiobolus meristosporus CBS 931.73]|eukprot:ORX69818.1 zincin [Basidiobolus meristosporus CBS 931.73]
MFAYQKSFQKRIGIVLIMISLWSLRISPIRSEAMRSLALKSKVHKMKFNLVDLKEEAEAILQDLDQAYNPCNDFYKFSCNTSSLRCHLGLSLNSLHQLTLLEILELEPEILAKSTEADRRIYNKARDFYNACLDVNKIESYGVKPLVPLLEIVLNEFPVAQNDKKIDFDKLTIALARISQQGIWHLFGVDVEADSKNPLHHAVYLMQPHLGLPSTEYYSEPQVLQTYQLSIMAILSQLSKDLKTLGHHFDVLSEANIKKLSSEIVKFEKLLSGYMANKEQMSNPTYTYNPYNLESLSKLSPNINWKLLFKTILSPPLHVNVSVHDSTVIVAKVPNFMRGNSQKLANRMISDIKKTFKDRLPTIKWLNKEGMEQAKEKIDHLVQKIGYPLKSPNIMSPESIERHYQHFAVDPQDYFGNAIRYRMWVFEKHFERIDKPVDRSEWKESPITVNAFYNHRRNEIAFPAGILQKPLYDANRPDYLNYGAIGTIMGHELTLWQHGFDNKGSLFDKYGKQRQWWDNSTIKAFTRKTECLVKQYSRFRVRVNGRDLPINPKLTLGENIADNAGIIEAYNAWKSSAPSSQEFDLNNPRLPGLGNMTVEQLFFVSFAQSAPLNEWQCLILMLSLQLRVDTHSPDKHRVNGVLRNNQEFAKAFNCPVGSPMNPPNKCTIW